MSCLKSNLDQMSGIKQFSCDGQAVKLVSSMDAMPVHMWRVLWLHAWHIKDISKEHLDMFKRRCFFASALGNVIPDISGGRSVCRVSVNRAEEPYSSSASTVVPQ